MHMARYAFSQTLLVHLAGDLIAANYNRSFLRSPLLFTIQRVHVCVCVCVRVGEHRTQSECRLSMCSRQIERIHTGKLESRVESRIEAHGVRITKRWINRMPFRTKPRLSFISCLSNLRVITYYINM